MSGIINLKGSLARILRGALLWHVRELLGAKGGPLAATFQLTNRCNLRCVMCNIPNNPAQGVLHLESFTKIARELNGLGCCFASLSGGEVLTIPGFFDYVREAKSNIASVNMVTNGLLVDEDVARNIRQSGIDSVSISLDGMREAHERTRNCPGAFDKTVAAIELIKKLSPKTKIVVNTVITPWNISELYELTGFVEGLGVRQKFQPLNEHPRFEGQTRPYSVEKDGKFDPAQVRDLVDFLLKKKNVANSRYFLESIPAYLLGGPKGGLFADRCHLPRFYCEFREDGRMYPCLGGMNWKSGYPVELGVKNIFYDSGYAKDVKRLEGCKACQTSYSVCYIEPRVAFPAKSFLKYGLMTYLKKTKRWRRAR